MTQFLRKTLTATAVAAAMSVASASFAQAPAAAPAAPAANKAIDAKFKSEKEKFGYLVGTKVGENLSQIKDEVDQAALVAALQESLKGVKPKLTPEELNQVNQEFMQKHQAAAMAKRAEEAKKNQADGDAFLAKNKAKAGVKTTESGLQYEVIKEGTGPKPKATDTVKVEYVGTKIDGTKFDASADHGGPATFPLNGVIPGWTEGVQLMSVGSKYKLYVPSKLAYGENGPGPIGPNATLIFDVTLVGIEPPAPAAGNAKTPQPVDKPAAAKQ
ncbi:FKBP-type peptidyl-prolyl cis-trans isomerase [Rudaea sp.]|uniref:FKBP-type peptidyl-prolyl cis-trans isomerase n=1 Tax=Rudaea sp. TaxID=2136325 RepID=UPI002ED446EB